VTGIKKPIKKQNDKLSLAKVRVIGNVLFDGSLYTTREFHHTIMYVNSSYDLVKRFCKDVKEVYGVSPSIFKENGKSVPIYRAKYNSILIKKDLLNYMKSYSTSSKLAKIPRAIMKGTLKTKLNFLRTFWDNEGSVASRTGRLSGTSKSYRVILQLAKLHKKLGFKFSVYSNTKSGCYILCLSQTKNYFRKFYDYKLFTKSTVTRGPLIGLRKIDVLKRFL
ncbi:hypothetical protein HYT51_00585, partial [Candidatus Woesearchaeota archaeon]|nr:hypothetical protein [Candidatus Woesearchaeota archaeon]